MVYHETSQPPKSCESNSIINILLYISLSPISSVSLENLNTMITRRTVIETVVSLGRDDSDRLKLWPRQVDQFETKVKVRLAKTRN